MKSSENSFDSRTHDIVEDICEVVGLSPRQLTSDPQGQRRTLREWLHDTTWRLGWLRREIARRLA